MAWSVELHPDDITINRDERQRRELVGIEELAASIERYGQLQPVVITRKRVLVAGERRLTAIRSLGDRKVRCVYTDEVDPAELTALEYEENIRREDLTWQDECAAVAGYHALQCSRFGDWSVPRTATALGMSATSVNDKILVAEALAEEDRMVVEAKTFSTARGIISRKNERALSSELSTLTAVALPTSIAIPVPQPAGTPEGSPELFEGVTLADLGMIPGEGSTGYILNEDFNLWAADYAGPKFNFIHCDFPYGIGMDHSAQGAGDAYGAYEDSPETYWRLVDSLLNNLDNFCEPSAHVMFWFSMDFYQPTLERLRTRLDVNPFPLIWYKSDNSGIIPDANRGPRRVYETAFLASRGDRKIVKAVSNVAAAGITKRNHMSEKTGTMLDQFFRMLVDESTSILDPTCGSGSALRAAARAGASRWLGLEVNTEYAEIADDLLRDELKALEQ